MKQKLTSCLYPVYSLWQAGCCGFDAWKIGLREPFSGGKFSIKGGRSGRKIHTVVRGWWGWGGLCMLLLLLVFVAVAAVCRGGGGGGGGGGCVCCCCCWLLLLLPQLVGMVGAVWHYLLSLSWLYLRVGAAAAAVAAVSGDGGGGVVALTVIVV